MSTAPSTTLDYGDVRKLFLKGFLGFLVITALLATLAILTNLFGDYQERILGTSAVITVTSILALSCAAYLERNPSNHFGLVGIASSVLAATLAIIAMWAEIQASDYIKVMLTAFVPAVGCALAFLLLLAPLDARYAWAQTASTSSITVLGVMLTAMIWGDFQAAWYLDALAVMWIVVGLATLAIPIMMKLSTGEPNAPVRLTLTHIEGDHFRDAAGRRFRVESLDGNEDPFPDQD